MIRPGPTLDPPTVSAPAFIAVQLTLISADGKGHLVRLNVRGDHTLRVPAGGRVSTLIAGLREGRYSLLVDGAPRGALNIGGEPGP
jgi:hypothetical protein